RQRRCRTPIQSSSQNSLFGLFSSSASSTSSPTWRTREGAASPDRSWDRWARGLCQPGGRIESWLRVRISNPHAPPWVAFYYCPAPDLKLERIDVWSFFGGEGALRQRKMLTHCGACLFRLSGTNQPVDLAME